MGVMSVTSGTHSIQSQRSLFQMPALHRAGELYVRCVFTSSLFLLLLILLKMYSLVVGGCTRHVFRGKASVKVKHAETVQLYASSIVWIPSNYL